MQPLSQRIWTTYLPRAASTGLRTLPRQFPCYACACARPTARFSTSTPRRAKKPPTPPPKAKANKPAPSSKNGPRELVLKPTTKALPKSDPRSAWQSLRDSATGRGAFNPVVQRFVSRSSPQLLYQAPSPALYVTGCYIIGGFCLVYAAWNSWTVLVHPPEGLRTWVVYAIGGISLFVTVFGVYVLRKSHRLVRSVSVVPTPTPSGTAPSLMLHVESFRTLPGRRLRTLVVPYEAATITGRFYKFQKPETEEEKLYREFLEQERQQWERDHIYSLPFRQGWDKIRRFFWFMRGLFTDDGFAFLRFKDRRGTWRLDEKPAWVLEGGKPFDALIKQSFATW